VTTRRAVTRDAEALQALRFQALLDSPGWFSTTFEREAARTTADWARWLSPGATFIFEGDSAEPAGLIAVVVDAESPTVASVEAMWVHPDVRRSHASDELLEAVVVWAKDNGATALTVDVVESNLPALRLYRRHGFLRTRRRRVRASDELTEVEMIRPIPPG
jgi:ribosomal protein S18 acetylase RimI-like enzyme